MKNVNTRLTVAATIGTTAFNALCDGRQDAAFTELKTEGDFKK
jgi:hypothetical protein